MVKKKSMQCRVVFFSGYFDIFEVSKLKADSVYRFYNLIHSYSSSSGNVSTEQYELGMVRDCGISTLARRSKPKKKCIRTVDIGRKFQMGRWEPSTLYSNQRTLYCYHTTSSHKHSSSNTHTCTKCVPNKHLSGNIAFNL